MEPRLLASLPLVLLLAGTCPAQASVVLPDAAYATSLGGTNNNAPFSTVPTRYQQLFDGQDVGGPNLFRLVQFRPATGFGKPTYGGQMVQMELLLGVTPVHYSSFSTTFAVNNPNPTTVRRLSWVQMPLFRAENPADWQVTIPFDQPWPWPGQNHLCVEVKNWGNTNNNAAYTYPLDATSNTTLAKSSRVYDKSGPNATTGTITGLNYGLIMRFGMAAGPTDGYFNNYGNGCSSSAGPMVSGLKEVPRIGATLNYTLYQAPAGASALFLLGTSASQWGAIPLPFDLTAAGAPGCSLDTSIFLATFALANASGAGTTALAVPSDRNLLGASLYSQWLVVDPGLNALGVATAPGSRSVLGL